jgi:mannosyltransferase
MPVRSSDADHSSAAVGPQLGAGPQAGAGAILAGAVMALALVAMSVKKPALATTWTLLPAAALLAVSALTPMWIPRYLLFILPAWMLLGSMALRRLSILRGLGAVLAIGLLALPPQLEIRRSIGHGQATKGIAAGQEAHRQPGDRLRTGVDARPGDQRSIHRAGEGAGHHRFRLLQRQGFRRLVAGR